MNNETNERLLDERNKLLDAIPECAIHGRQCVPHALEWIENAKEQINKRVLGLNEKVKQARAMIAEERRQKERLAQFLASAQQAIIYAYDQIEDNTRDEDSRENWLKELQHHLLGADIAIDEALGHGIEEFLTSETPLPSELPEDTQRIGD